ncbi:MAG: type II toxin-antitoxin system Phd/YefM family antitoxin [Gammaproteobacteria bacterium]
MRWNIAQAKQNLSEVVRNATTEPQLIYNRDRLVAAVVGAETFEVFRTWQGRAEGRSSLADRFADFRQIAESEGYVFELGSRSDRHNPLTKTLDEVPR